MIAKMDTTRIFAAREYLISGESQTTILGRILITLKSGWLIFFYLMMELFSFVFWRALRIKTPKDIRDEVALVTGGGNGLGKAIALRLAKEMCHVAIVDIDIEAAEKTAAEAQSLGVKAKAYKIDVSNYEDLVNLKSEITKDLGCVSILVNNAALIALVPMTDTPKDQIQRVIDVNITSQIWSTKIFLEDMVEHGKGHIIQICSLYGLIHGKSTVYSLSKHAIHGFMSCLKEEIHGKNWQDKIKTTCVYPFFIATRKELTDVMKKSDMIINTPEYAADKIVQAIKNEEDRLTIPKGYYTLIRFFSLLPTRSIRKFYSATFGKTNRVW